MELVKLEIDGKRIIADNRRTILEVARQHGIGNIPTLCHDEQLEPFASCFVCVVKVKGARTLVPACTTRVSQGMVVETDSPEVRRSRKAALELLLSNHFADCVGPCQLACPAGVDIQGYIALAALGKHREAIELIKEKNPLPAVCGRVCTRPCEVKGCRRNLLDEPVGIDWIKRYLADLDLASPQPWRPRAAAPNGRRVAVVGAGPAGLSAAWYLALRGYQVQIFEAMPEPGGMLRYGIPEYRLPKEDLDFEISQILDLGVKLSTSMALGRDFTIASLKEQGFAAVFVGLGAWENSKMRVPGEDAEGVLAGIDFLREHGLRRSSRLEGTVLVVGGGNTAIDCARTALRLGASEVRLLYRRTRKEMPANESEIADAEREGVKIDLLVAPVRVIKKGNRIEALECQRMELGEPDASGRRSPRPIKGSEHRIPCDWAIAAIGQNAEVQKLVAGRVPGFLPPGESLTLTRWQTIQAHEQTFETSVEGVFAGGDVVTGAATAIEAIAAGRKAAHAIDAYLTGGKARPERVEVISRKDAFRKVTPADLRSDVKSERRHPACEPPGERIRSFVEVEKAYSHADVRHEASRCQECGCIRYFDCDLRRYATEYGADVSTFMGEAKEHPIDRTHPLIELDPNKCILCGRCVRMCSELVGVACYGYVRRGFNTVVRPALGGSLLDTDCLACGQCVETCPTAAIVEKSRLAKPGPWPTTSVPTVCSYCGVGCRLNWDTFGGVVVKVSRGDARGPLAGNHCRKGRFGYTYVQAPDRLARAYIRSGRELGESALEEALAHTAVRLKELRRKYSGAQTAVFVSPRLTNEEIYLAQKLARVALGTHQVTTFAALVNRELDCPEVVSTASYRDLEDAQAIVVVNADLEERHFAAGLACKKALRKGARLVCVGPDPGEGLARLADVFVRCEDGEQARAVLGLLQEALPGLEGRPHLKAAQDKLGAPAERQELREAAAILKGALLKVVVFDKDYPGTRRAGDERLFAEAAQALGATVLALREKANMQGLLDMGASPQWLPGYLPVGDARAVEALEKAWCVPLHGLDGAGADLAGKLARREIKIALVLGEDPLGDEGFPRELREGLLAAELLAVGDLFFTATAQRAQVVLPLSSAAETNGTYTNLERRVQPLSQAIPPVAGMETWQILRRLGEAMGFRFKVNYASTAEIAEEIRRVVPAYRPVKPGASDAEGLWDLAALRLPGVAADAALAGPPIKRVPTLRLDAVEARFESWFEDLFARARPGTTRAGAAEAPPAPRSAPAAG